MTAVMPVLSARLGPHNLPLISAKGSTNDSPVEMKTSASCGMSSGAQASVPSARKTRLAAEFSRSFRVQSSSSCGKSPAMSVYRKGFHSQSHISVSHRNVQDYGGGGGGCVSRVCAMYSQLRNCSFYRKMDLNRYC